MVIHGEVVVMTMVAAVAVFGGLVPYLRRRRAKVKNSGPIPDTLGEPRFPPPSLSRDDRRTVLTEGKTKGGMSPAGGRRTPRPAGPPPSQRPTAPPGDAYATRGRWPSTAPDFGEPWSWPQVDGQSVSAMVWIGDRVSKVTLTRRCGRYVITDIENQ